jgi:hypothetical protein
MRLIKGFPDTRDSLKYQKILQLLNPDFLD